MDKKYHNLSLSAYIKIYACQDSAILYEALHKYKYVIRDFDLDVPPYPVSCGELAVSNFLKYEEVRR